MKFNLLILVFSLILLWGCSGVFNNPVYIPPSAQITNIYNITDSSAQVDVQITEQSNAQWGGMDLFVYFYGTLPSSNYVSGIIIGNDPLPTSFSGKISNLKSQTEYSLQLYFEGQFDNNGGQIAKDFYVGTPKTFKTN